MLNETKTKQIVIDDVTLDITMVSKNNTAPVVVQPLNDNSGLWVIGKNYFVRTVTYHFIGTLLSVDKEAGEMLFGNASWVASSGRWYEALNTGKLSEVEPFIKPIIVNRTAFIDSTEWTHALPDSVK